MVNPIWTSLQIAGVPVPAGYTYNATNVATALPTITDTATGATYDAKSHGVEVELTANITDQWRVFANYSRGSSAETNIGPEELTYLALWRPFWLAHSTVPISGGAAGATVATQIAAVDNAVFNRYTLADGQEPLGQERDRVNLETAYDFTSSWLKGVTIGGGANYNSAPVTGYFSTGSPSTGISSRVTRGSDQIFFDGNIGYRHLFKLAGKPVMWSVQLNVNNVFNNDAFVKLRVSSVGETELYTFNPPREYIVSTKFNF
jgi:outer membrane receptor for ferric coprogen and ferric-rhodotorulic acid